MHAYCYTIIPKSTLVVVKVSTFTYFPAATGSRMVRVRKHCVHTLIRLPLTVVNHWRFGYLRVLLVGLYLPRSNFLVTAITDFFPQFSQRRAIVVIH